MNRKNKQFTLEEITQKIPNLINDDEILYKLTLNFLANLQDSLSHPDNMKDFQNSQEIINSCWPYSFENNNQDLNSQEKTNNQTNIIQDSNYKSKKRHTLESQHLNILILIQRKFGDKIKLSELAVLAKNLSIRTNIPCRKKDRLSKERITIWLSHNWKIFEPLLDEELLNLKRG